MRDRRQWKRGQQSAGGYATFSYDPVSNVLTKRHEGESPRTYTYDLAQRIVTMAQGSLVTSYLYDGAGNLTREDAGGSVTTKTYDPENRLAGIAHPDGTLSTYAYQGYDGLRRSKHEPGGALATFVWDGGDYLQERS
jgi:YD repeat-containing protein